MSRFLLYFNYWYAIDEALELAIDFDPNQKSSTIIDELIIELAYHTGEDEPDPNSILFLETFNLRPFHPAAWDMTIDRFISKYGNKFTVVDLKQHTIGKIEYFIPNQLRNVQRAKLQKITVKSQNWSQRAKLELQLITSLIRWLTHFPKSKWLQGMIPYEQGMYFSRVWKVESSIPETDYTAQWRIILPENYPNEPPVVYIRHTDVNILPKVDYSKIWTDKDGQIYFLVSGLTKEIGSWSPELFLADFILAGFWNFLIRSLKETYPIILFYKHHVGHQKLLEIINTEQEEMLDHKLWGLFFTWLLQRVPEKAIKELNNLQSNTRSHPILAHINWRLTEPSVSADKLKPFKASILSFFQKKGLQEQFLRSDLDFVKDLLSDWGASPEADEFTKWLDTKPKIFKVNSYTF